MSDPAALGLAANARNLALASRNGLIPLAALGDSKTAYGVVNTPTIQGYNMQGYPSWLQVISGQRFYYPIENNFGVAGNTLSQMATRVPDVIASGAKVVIFEGGTNDLSYLTPFATMQSIMVNQILAPLLNAGILLIVLPISARTSGLVEASVQVRARFNRWLQRIGEGWPDVIAGTPIPPWNLPLVINTDQFILSRTPSDTFPNAVPGILSTDGLHQSGQGAYWVARAIWNTISGMFAGHSAVPGIGNNDSFDPVNNPNGSLLTAGYFQSFGVMTGTGGVLATANGVTPTGSVADNWTAERAYGSSNATMVLAKENPRSDGPLNGERQRVTITCTQGSIANEQFLLKYYIGTSSLVTLNVGDEVYAECAFQLASVPSNFNGFDLQIVESGPSSSQTASSGYCNPTFLPPSTLDSAAGNWPNIQIPERLIFRTPTIKLQTGISGLFVYPCMWMRTDSGAAFADGWISDVSVRKVLY